MPDVKSAHGEVGEPGIWSIGLYQGKSLDKLFPIGADAPIVTGRDFRQWGGNAVADPFALRRSDAWYLFFELFQKESKNAVIGASRSEDLQRWEPLGVVLRQEHHLSYPFVFEHDGEIYMMPESKSVKRVDLYRAVEFPNRWVFDRTLLRGRYMDCSMIGHAGRYWMFAGWRSYWLRLFYAPSPLGPWKRHWMPAIRNYSRSSTRPGGRPICLDGQLIRFSQDNTRYYGEQLRAWNVTKLNRLWYSERPRYVDPILKGSGKGWNALCMHHIDAFQGEGQELLAFVDGSA